MPAKKQNRNIGKVPAAASSATKIGSGVRLVISHAAPVVCIQPPTLDSTLAVHSRRKARLEKGAKAECGRATTGDGGGRWRGVHSALNRGPSRRGDGSCSAPRRPSG